MINRDIISAYSYLVNLILTELKCDLDPTLIYAIIDQESAGYPWAVRYEPTTPYRWHPSDYLTHNNNLATEVNNQKTSWGLMQVMGFTAREYGFKGISLSELLTDYNSIKYGVTYLLNRRAHFSEFPDYVAAYNQGSNYKNVDGTYTHAEHYVRSVLDKQFMFAELLRI